MGQIYGKAGGSLSDNTWTHGSPIAKIGQKGERKLAEIINRYARQTNIAVLHDLRLPSDKYTANIDHVIVDGNKVRVLDSKVWQNGIYFTAFKKCYRITDKAFFPKRFPSGEKHTMGLIVDTLNRYLSTRAHKYKIVKPCLVVMPSNPQSAPSNFRFYSPESAQVADIRRFESRPYRYMGRGLDAPNNEIVNALRGLCFDGGAR
jgi:hypothetical protein